MKDLLLTGFLAAVALAAFLIAAFSAGREAEEKGRSYAGWLILGLVTGPLAYMAACAASKDDVALLKQGLLARKLKTCPACDEAIKARATVCKHCGTPWVAPVPSASHYRYTSAE